MFRGHVCWWICYALDFTRLCITNFLCWTLWDTSSETGVGWFVRVVREAGKRYLSVRDLYMLRQWIMRLSKMAAVVVCREMSLILLEAAARGFVRRQGRAHQLLPPVSLLLKTLVFIMKEQEIIRWWGWSVEVRNLSFSMIACKVEGGQPNYPQREVPLIVDRFSFPFHWISKTDNARTPRSASCPGASICFHLFYIQNHFSCPFRKLPQIEWVASLQVIREHMRVRHIQGFLEFAPTTIPEILGFLELDIACGACELIKIITKSLTGCYLHNQKKSVGRCTPDEICGSRGGPGRSLGFS